DLTIEDMLNDLNVHPRAHVGWKLDSAALDRFSGTLDPLELGGMLSVETRDFGVYDRPSVDPHRRPYMTIDRGTVAGMFRVTPEGVVMSNMAVRTGSSFVRTTVSLGYEERLGLAVHEGTVVDLRDISPLASIPMEGRA